MWWKPSLPPAHASHSPQRAFNTILFLNFASPAWMGQVFDWKIGIIMLADPQSLSLSCQKVLIAVPLSLEGQEFDVSWVSAWLSSLQLPVRLLRYVSTHTHTHTHTNLLDKGIQFSLCPQQKQNKTKKLVTLNYVTIRSYSHVLMHTRNLKDCWCSWVVSFGSDWRRFHMRI